MAADFHGVDQELLERVRFRENPRACISDETVAYAASLIRQIPEYRKALKQEMAVAVPEKRTGLFGLKRIPPVMAWRVISISYSRYDGSWDRYIPHHLQAFMGSDGRLYCGKHKKNDLETYEVFKSRPTPQSFAKLLLETFMESETAFSDPDALNRWLQEKTKSVFENYMVPDKDVKLVTKNGIEELHICEELIR